MTGPERTAIISALEDCLYMAVLLARLFADNPGGMFQRDQVPHLAGVPFGRTSEALAALDRFEELDLCATTDVTLRPGPDWVEQWDSLADMLQGALVYQELVLQKKRQEQPRVVITTPYKDGLFAKMVKDRTGLYVRSDQTAEVFRTLAENAIQRLVVATPFLDREGAEMVKDLFLRTDPKVEKHLVLRFLNDPESRRCVRGIDWIEADLLRMGVAVHDFTLQNSTGGRETFHAKIVVKDSDQAYVGSANLTRAHSIEIGLLVFGEAAEKVADSVDIILKLTQVV